MVDIRHTPARIVDDHPIRNSLHDVFTLASMAVRNLRQAIDAAKETGVLYGQSCLLGKLFEELNLLCRKPTCSSMIDLNRP